MFFIYVFMDFIGIYALFIELFFGLGFYFLKYVMF